MIDYYNIDYGYNHRINIHTNFPKQKLVDIMKPYLYLYYSHKYSLVTTKKVHSKNILYSKLNKFYVFNPAFGREQIKIHKYFSKNIKKYKKKYTYNDKLILFYQDSKTFLTSHLSDK